MGARLEKVWQGWRRVKLYFLWALAILAIAGAILALIYVPKMQVPVCPQGKDGMPSKICFDIENEGRKTLAYIMGGILAIIGIYMAHRRIRALERQVQIGQEQLQVGQEGQITERFTRAIEQLGSDRMEIRLGGIYALERIANDSDKDYWPIMETLTAYVRERAPWREPDRDIPEEFTWEEAKAPEESTSPISAATFKLATDIQAILTVLGRRKYSFGQGEDQRLDLRETDLQKTKLIGAHFEKADFYRSNLENSILIEANLIGAWLREANLKEARLDKANLEEADLSEAYLVGAHLIRTNLKNADLNGSQLKRARFFRANLEGAYFELANLQGAKLRGANLKGADLTAVIGLTKDQLDGAILDEGTILPEYLQKEFPEVKGPEGNSEE